MLRLSHRPQRDVYPDGGSRPPAEEVRDEIYSEDSRDVTGDAVDVAMCDINHNEPVVTG